MPDCPPSRAAAGRRLWVRRGPKPDITCQAVLDGTPLGASLVDLSAGGACVALTLPLAHRAGLTLRLFNHRRLYSLTLNALVAWCAPRGEREYRVGCQFETPPPLAVLLPLLS